MNCDRCESDATWLVFAAYNIDHALVGFNGRPSGHPHVAVYPAPMGRLCSDHLGPFLDDDMEHPAQSGGWLVRPRPTSKPT